MPEFQVIKRSIDNKNYLNQRVSIYFDLKKRKAKTGSKRGRYSVLSGSKNIKGLKRRPAVLPKGKLYFTVKKLIDSLARDKFRLNPKNDEIRSLIIYTVEFYFREKASKNFSKF